MCPPKAIFFSLWYSKLFCASLTVANCSQLSVEIKTQMMNIIQASNVTMTLQSSQTPDGSHRCLQLWLFKAELKRTEDFLPLA
jgi:hypothetical protein